jgi:PPOX class probable F420-dependent enzyme
MANIPENVLDLFEKPIICALATLMGDGQPHVNPVWCAYDGQYLCVNTVRGRQKDLNMQHRAKVTALLVDPSDDGRWVEVRGHIAESTEEGAVEDINRLALKYTGKDFRKLKPGEVRVIYKIMPDRVILG